MYILELMTQNWRISYPAVHQTAEDEQDGEQRQQSQRQADDDLFAEFIAEI